MVFNNMIMRPPPSTVSIVLHNIFGVMDSKSYKTNNWYVFPKIFYICILSFIKINNFGKKIALEFFNKRNFIIKKQPKILWVSL